MQAAGGQALDFTDAKTLEETWYKSATYKELQTKDIRDTESWAQGNDKVTLSGDEFQKVVNKFAMDEGSQQKINTVVQAVTADATAFVGGDETKEFNYGAVRNNVMNNIINSKDANLRSLANDNIWGSTSWKDDLNEALTNATYEDMGINIGTIIPSKNEDGTTIPMEQRKKKGLVGLKGGGMDSIEWDDPNTDGDNDPTTITEEDRKVIIKAIMDDQLMLKETLGDYYTKIAENNYNAQSGKNKKNNTKDDEDEFA